MPLSRHPSILFFNRHHQTPAGKKNASSRPPDATAAAQNWPGIKRKSKPQLVRNSGDWEAQPSLGSKWKERNVQKKCLKCRSILLDTTSFIAFLQAAPDILEKTMEAPRDWLECSPWCLVRHSAHKDFPTILVHMHPEPEFNCSQKESESRV